MDKVIFFPLTDSFVVSLADIIEDQYVRPQRDLSRLALVFGGQRPRLFLQKELAGRLKRSFLPPRFFSIDEFIQETLRRKERFGLISDMDACYLIFQLARKHAPQMLAQRQAFSQFNPWAREILAFIEQLDLQAIPAAALKDIQLHADIGYEVPASINALLQNIVVLREAFHRSLIEKKLATRGLLYSRAAGVIEDVVFDDFDEIYFCNFFYLHKTEERIMKALTDAGKARLFFQGDPAEWPVLEAAAKNFDTPVMPENDSSPGYELFLHAGFDGHSQICALRDVLKNVKDPEKTLIVLPDPAAVMPLLSEIASHVKAFNVSMGYPASRSSVAALFDGIFETQATRKERRYYAKDYLRVLGHPLIKNVSWEGGEASTTRILIHKIEEAFLGMETTEVSGHLFVSLDDIVRDEAIFEAASQMGQRLDASSRPADLKKIILTLHEVLFKGWEDVRDTKSFADRLERLLDLLLSRSYLEKYPFHLKILEKMYDIVAQFRHAAFGDEVFPPADLFRIFRNKIENESVAFSGSPLKGLQILGVMETRSLSFDHVLILDANETSLPKLKIHEPLIPRDVMIALGLDRLEKEEEIQRYQFRRLIASARRVDLFYAQTDKSPRSRFIEELVWEREKEKGELGAVPVARSQFRVNVGTQESAIQKTPQHIAALKTMRFSASSLDTYLRCPLRFFYQYVMGLSEKEDLLGEPEATDIGNFIHGLLEDTFKKFIGHKPRLDDKFESHFFDEFESRFEKTLARKMPSDAFLVKEVLRVRLAEFLKAERARPVAALLGVEKVYEEEVSLGGQRLKIKAKVDRLDRLDDGSLLVVDYKTGTTDVMPRQAHKCAGGTLSRILIKSAVRSFQLPLYVHLAMASEKCDVNAALYYLRHAERESGFKKLFQEEDTREARAEALGAYLRACGFIVDEIFDPAMPFAPDTEDPGVCGYCPFFALCR